MLALGRDRKKWSRSIATSFFCGAFGLYCSLTVKGTDCSFCFWESFPTQQSSGWFLSESPSPCTLQRQREVKNRACLYDIFNSCSDTCAQHLFLAVTKQTNRKLWLIILLRGERRTENNQQLEIKGVSGRKWGIQSSQVSSQHEISDLSAPRILSCSAREPVDPLTITIIAHQTIKLLKSPATWERSCSGQAFKKGFECWAHSSARVHAGIQFFFPQQFYLSHVSKER